MQSLLRANMRLLYVVRYSFILIYNQKRRKIAVIPAPNFLVSPNCDTKCALDFHGQIQFLYSFRMQYSRACVCISCRFYDAQIFGFRLRHMFVKNKRRKSV